MGRRGLCSFHKPGLSSGATSRSGEVVGASEVLLHLPASVDAARGLSCVLRGAGQGWEHGLGWENVDGPSGSLGLCASLTSLEVRGCPGEGPLGRRQRLSHFASQICVLAQTP